MPLIYLLFFPLFGSFIGCLVIFALLAVLDRQMKSHSLVESKLKEMIDERLSAVIAMFKLEIPMIGTFLTPTREKSFKEKASTELVKMLPSIKEKLVASFSDNKMFLSYGAALGFVLGLLQAVIVYFFF